jgi:hypothetical protein
MKRLLLVALLISFTTSCDFIADTFKRILILPDVELKEEEPVKTIVEYVPNRVFSCGYDGFVNVRGWPSYKSRVIAQFRNGPEGAALLEHRGEWTKIDMGGIVGWVPTKYVWHTPTVAYTGYVDVDWVAGAWCNNNGYGYVLYSNGYWEYGYNFPVLRGYYIMQNNEVKLVSVTALNIDSGNWEWTGAIGSSNDDGCVLEINVGAGKLGELEKSPFLTEGEAEEYEGGEWTAMSKSQFKSGGKECAAQVQKFLR